jgi:hypothetical protein
MSENELSEDEKARVERIAGLAYHCAHGDEDEGMRIALELWDLSDEQLAEFARYILMGASPLRDMSRVKETI